MPRYNYRRRRYYRQSASRFGSERAREHIAAARRLTQELGGADDVGTVATVVQQHVDRVVSDYQIPAHLNARFDWLAADDVGVKQKLLNYVRTLEKSIALQAVKVQLPVLLEHLRADAAGHTKRL